MSLKEVSFKVSELLEDNENIEMEVKLKNKIPTEIQNEISILYNFRENARLRRESINISISYELVLRLKKPMDVRRSVLKAYAENSGLLLVYPYIRHQVDMLIREAGYILPPLPHVLLKL